MSIVKSKDFELPERCPMCNGKTHQFEDNKYGCEDCKRVWVNDGNGEWHSEIRQVRIKKMPEPGDDANDVFEPL